MTARVLVVGDSECAGAVRDTLDAVNVHTERLDDADLGAALSGEPAADLVVAITDSSSASRVEWIDDLSGPAGVPWLWIIAGRRALAVGPAFSSDSPCPHCVSGGVPRIPGPPEPPWPLALLPPAIAAALDAPIGIGRCTVLRLSRSPRAHFIGADPLCSCRSIDPVEVIS